MQRLPKALVATTQITAAAVTYYTAPALTIADIAAATATNVTATPQTVTVNVVASGIGVSAVNVVVQLKTVPANTSVQLWELIGLKLPAGSFISAVASAGAAINLAIGGYEVNA